MKNIQYTINIPVYRLFERWGVITPKAVAVTEPIAKKALTYDELNRRADRLARFLKRKGLETGDIVALMVERSVEMMVGILAILKAGAIYLPINPRNPSKRIAYYFEDSGARFLLSHRSYKKNSGIPCYVDVIDLEDSALYEWDVKDRGDKDNCKDIAAGSGLDVAEVSHDDFAYIIYTSGSTGNPKGVPITHGNLCQLLHWGYDVLNLQPVDRVVQNLSYFFDWSVWEMFITLTSGATLVVPPDDVLLNPVPYRDFLTNNRVTVLHITPTQFHGLIGYGSEPNKLETLKHLCIGAEKLVYDLVEKSFAAVGDSCRVYNMYGPTETTIMAAVLEIARSDFQRYRDLTSIPIGLPVGNAQLSVLDSDMNPVGLNEKGELYIGGNGVARGYLNNPQLTVDRFIKINETSFYKTGDIVRLLPENNIEFVGRIDHQLKIRGYRVELGEIENQLVVHPSISAAAVIAVDPPKGTAAPGSELEKHLCAYYVAAGGSVQSQSVSNRELREFLSLRLPQYMVPSFFVSLESIPLNANGKIDIKVLPLPTTGDAGVPYIAPQNAVEKFLAEIWSTSLGLDVEVVGIDDNFFQLGGHSLRAAAVTSEIFKKYNVKVSIEELFRNPTIRELFNVVNTSVKEDYRPVEAVEKRDYYPLAPAQERLYILYYTAEADTVGYNIPLVLELSEEPSLSRLEETFQQLIRLYESFRTYFIMKGDQPVQRIMAVGDIDFRLEHLKCEASTPSIEGDTAQSDAPPEAVSTLMHRFVKPFDLSRPPLMRAALVNSADHRYFLLVDLHHIISDGISVEEFKARFTGLYKGLEITVPVLQYKDYALWLYSEMLGPRSQRQKEYWLERFSSELPQLNLPTDYRRPSFVNYSGASIRFQVPPRDTHSLRRLASQENTTLYVVVGASFTVMLSKLSAVEDIIIGSPASGRSHPDLESMMGMFVNTLALRTFPTGEKQFRLFLREVRQTLLEAMENQDYPFDRLVTQLNLERDPSRNPLFDVMIALDTTGPVDDGAFLRPRRFRLKASLLDILLEVTDGESVYITLEYATSLFKEETIQGFLRYLKQVIAHVADSPQSELRDIDILSQQEKDELLVGFNGTGEIYLADQSLVRLFENRVAEDADGIAVCGFGGSAWFDSDATTGGDTMFTYRQLNEKSTRLARYLMERGVRPGHMVALLTDRSVEMVVGMLAILKSGAAYVPLDPTAPLTRLKYITNECNVQLLLTRSNIITDIPYDADYVCIDQEKIYYDVSSVPLDTVVDAALNAYVIFTSGSTGKPKGVAITHGNLSPLLHWGYRHLCIGSSERTLQNLSYYFDWSVWEIFITLTSGAALCIVPRETLLNPVECIKFIRDKGITVLHATPTQYSYLVDIDQHPLPLNYLFLGAEKLTLDLVQRSFQSVGQDCRVFNMYGPTEATIISAVLEIDREDSEGFSHLTSVPIGVSVGNTHLLILDKYLNFCPVNVTGELYIAGHGVAAGYLCDPEKTASSFISNVYNSKGVIGERLYKTGDLARRLPDGTIEFLGRIDHQVKIRGFRIELGEIENRLLEHDKIKEAVVIAATPHEKSKNTEKFLCAYVVSKSSEDLQQIDTFSLDIKNSLAQILPDYMIPSHIILLEDLPLNPNGKVNLKALPQPEQVAEAAYIAPRDHLEQRLVQIWSQVLDMEEKKIGIDDNFFHLGGHSLKGTVVSSKVHREFNVKLTLSAIFKTPTIRALALLINQSVSSVCSVIPKAPILDEYPLTSPQKRLWFLHIKDPSSTAYNMPQIWTLKCEPHRKRLKKAFEKIIKRHDVLRTYFTMSGDEPVQRILPDIDFKINYLCNIPSKIDMKTIVNPLIQPFDLSHPPLMRVNVLKDPKDQWVLLVDMHHIISDGISFKILEKDLDWFYTEEGMISTPLTIQYKDYAYWVEQRKRGGTHNKSTNEEKYWLDLFSDRQCPILNLPLDFPRADMQNSAGGFVLFQLNAKVSDHLKTLARNENTTLYMVILAAVYVLIARLSGQEDILIGTTVAGRGRQELENLIGMFVNTLVLRNFPSGNKEFNHFLREITQRTLTAFENEDYPLEELVKHVDSQRDPGRNPLFDVFFTHFPRFGNSSGEGELGLKPYPRFEIPISKFDLSISFDDPLTGDPMEVTFNYASRLFKEDTIQRFTRYFQNLVTDFTNNPRNRLKDIEILDETEKKWLLIDLNNTGTRIRKRDGSGDGFPLQMTLHRLFEAQVKKTPDSAAVTGISHENDGVSPVVTYHELNRQAQILSDLLKVRGIGQDSIVALRFERSISMVVAMLAVLKAGGAYLPISITYPEARIRYILVDSGASLLLTQDCLIDKDSSLFASIDCDTVCIEQALCSNSCIDPFNTGNHKETSVLEAIPSSAAYVIYTSGTTGKPKGVLVEHRNAVNTVSWFGLSYNLEPGINILQMSDYSFDASVNQIFGTLLHGASLFLITRELLMEIEDLRQFIIKNKIHIINFVPTLLKELLDVNDRLGELHTVLSGAERLDDRTRNMILSKGYRLFNQYGPTESTVDALVSECVTHEDSVTLGKPIANTCCYILDSHLNPTPIGVTGQLYVSGAGIARGYLNRPELTAEKFIHNPFPSPFLKENASYFHNNRLYATGDLARRLPDGNVQFLGRRDHQVKIRGFRIELQEIETHLLLHKDIKEAVVLAINGKKSGDADLFLCAYVIPVDPEKISSPDSFSESLTEYFLQSLPDYMLPAQFMVLSTLPRTTGGKVNRKALPIPILDSKKAFIAPSDSQERRMVEIWAAVLNIDSSTVGVTDNFFQLGGHSLSGTAIIARIHKAFDVRLKLDMLFKYPTVRRLCHCVRNAKKEKHTAIPLVEKMEYYPLSSAQKRLFVLDRMEVNAVTYNIPQVWFLEREPDKDLLERAFILVIQRHESLRSRFLMLKNNPVQIVCDNTNFRLKYRNLTVHDSFDEVIKDFVHPFDLSHPPLIRAEVVKIPDNRWVLMVDIHHIVSDGVSFRIFKKELTAFYLSETLEPLNVQYKDYVLWQKNQKEGMRKDSLFDLQEAYWLNTLSGEIPVMNLPLDFPRPPIQSFSGNSISFEIDSQVTHSLNQMAKKENVTLYMILFAVFSIMNTKLSGQEDNIIGTPTAGRRHADMTSIIGMFVNTLAIRSRPEGRKTFRHFLKETAENVLNAFENQEYQFEDLLEILQVERDASRNPLFDVMFTLGERKNYVDEPGIEGSMKPYTLSGGIAKFDLTLSVETSTNCLHLELEYCDKLFKEESIQRFAGYYETIITAISGNSDIAIAEIDTLSPSEKQQLLYRFNDKEPQYPSHKTMHGLFEEQVVRTPHHTAVVDIFHSEVESGDTVCNITFEELNQESNRLAVQLIKRGVKPGDVVAVISEPSLNMILSLLSILKTGAAYLPLNPDNPSGRNRFMVADCDAKILVAQRENMVSEDLKSICQVIIPGNMTDSLSTIPTMVGERKPSDYAYIIFTSGSTGTPKGVPITHANISPLLHWGLETLGLGPRHRVVQNISYYFDWSVWEIFITLTSGATLYVPPPYASMDPNVFIQFLQKNLISVLHITPSQLQVLLQLELVKTNKADILEYLFIGAEKLSRDLVERSFAFAGEQCRVFNMYGPTEGTIIASTLEIKRNKLSLWNHLAGIPIGGPVGNAVLLVLDKYHNLCPVNVVGELYIAGDGISCGYINNAELTIERFLTSSITEGNHLDVDISIDFVYQVNNKNRTANNRLYKTGDLVRWLPDGNIDFQGRIDHQVKIRGFRIELGEIENCLTVHKNVREAIVLDRVNEAGSKYLCAYYIPLYTTEEENSTLSIQLREYLSAQLPDYMVPDHFIALASIPLTPNGKVDRKALPEPSGVGILNNENYVAPSSHLEKVISDVWMEVLGLEKISIHDKFFNIGGNSLNVVQMNSILNQRLGKDIPVVSMFRFTTITALASHLSEEGTDDTSTDTVSERRDKVGKGIDRRLERIKKRRSKR